MFSAPPLLAGSALERPQRDPSPGKLLERLAHRAAGGVLRPFVARPLALRPLLRPLAEEARRLEPMNEAAFAAEVAALRRAAPRSEASTVRRFALVREAARRRIGQRPYDVQMLGGLAMHRGCVAEMRTGEGKTLAATLPAAAAALSRVPVHVLTVNDYLAERDAGAMRPVYEALGLTVGCVLQGMAAEERRTHYACDIVYVTNKEIVFDWLRDRLALGEATGDALQRHARRLAGAAPPALLLRGLHCAVVDEADSVLLDEARTPLIISADTAPDPVQVQTWQQALTLVVRLREDEHYRLRHDRRVAELTPAGEARLKELSAGLGPAWAGALYRNELGRQALAALHLFRRDVQYLVADGKVVIIDEATGRTMPDRSWERGLHQMIESKENCPPTAERRTLSSVSYQRFFRHYHHLCGMTGTAREVTGELWELYRLPVMRIPTNRAMQLKRLPPTVCDDEPAKWQRVAARVQAVRQGGQPVLIGTRTVGQSEALSAALDEAGIPHRLLNARQHAEEAAIVAEAGQPGRVTIATNMAGRGTDILLGPGVAARGGLHVVATELHESGRIDRQLSGRSARQGDPGSTEMVLSMEDALLREGAPRLAALLARLPEGALRTRLALLAMRAVQRRLARRHAEDRRNLLLADEQAAEALGFTGGP